MIKVSAFTSGFEIPSSRFRVRQLIKPLLLDGVKVNELTSTIGKYNIEPKPWVYRISDYTGTNVQENWRKLKILKRLPQFISSKFSDIIWLERVLVPNKITYELKLKKPLVFDIDDAIWLKGTEGYGIIDKILMRSDFVFCGNQYLADYCSNYNKNIKVIPTSVDTSRFSPAPLNDNELINIGWIGTPSNFQFLKEIVPALRVVSKEIKNVRFLICSSEVPDLDLDFKFVKWSEETEVEFIRSLNIGLMPLPENEWTMGKCSFKMLQYLSCGIPAVASPVGMNKVVYKDWGFETFAPTNHSEWIDIIKKLCLDQSLRISCGEKGRNIIVSHYSSKVISRKIAETFKSLI